MGASIAFHLAQRKPGSIIVLDKHYVGHGAMDAAKPLTSALFGSVGLPKGFLSRRNTSTKTTGFVVPPSPRPHRPAEPRAERLMKVTEVSAQKSRKGAMHEKERSS
jgi:glycine/D-amino acid oxidase-like deaminating enzyme